MRRIHQRLPPRQQVPLRRTKQLFVRVPRNAPLKHQVVEHRLRPLPPQILRNLQVQKKQTFPIFMFFYWRAQ